MRGGGVLAPVMIFRMRILRKAAVVAASLAFATPPRAAAAAQVPDAAALLEAARLQPAGTPLLLEGRLRFGKRVTPLKILATGSQIRLEFRDPPQVLQLELAGDGAVLSEILPGRRPSTIPVSRYSEPVRGTPVTLEDLTFHFLYWKNPKVVGEDSVRTRPAWMVDIPAPRGRSQYGAVRLWLDQDSGALLRAEAFDPQARLVRRIEAVSAQKLDGRWLPRQVRMEVFDPGTAKITGRAYLEILGKAEP